MDMTALLDAFRDAIHDDAATVAWCQAQYVKHHRVLVGVDGRHPPDETLYPLVHLFPLRKTGGYELAVQEHQVGVTCGVYDPDERTTDLTYGTEKKGISQLEDFRKCVETAVVGAVPAGHRIDRLEIEYEALEFFPFFLANMTFTVTWDFAQGNDPFR